MKLSFKCPKCGRRSIVRMGVVLKVKALYHLAFDYIDRPVLPEIAAGRLLSHSKSPMQKKLMKDFLGFCCQHCGHEFSSQENQEIFEYLQKRKVLDNLRR